MAHHLALRGTVLSRGLCKRQSFLLLRRHASKSDTQPPVPPPSSSSSKIKELFTASAIGGTAGVLGSLAGMGGGFVMIPLMTSRLLKLTQHQAHGTSLFAVAATGLAGASSYSEHVVFESAAAVTVCAIFTARLGAQMTSKLSGPMLRRALGALMLAMAPAVPLKAYVLEHHQAPSTEETATTTGNAKLERPFLERVLPPAAIGMVSGFLAGLFGVGGGTIVVPALALATDMTHHQALATSLAAMILPAMVGTVTHAQAGNVAFRIAPALALGAAVGAVAGAKLAVKTDETTLRWGFSGLLGVLGVRTLFKA